MYLHVIQLFTVYEWVYRNFRNRIVVDVANIKIKIKTNKVFSIDITMQCFSSYMLVRCILKLYSSFHDLWHYNLTFISCTSQRCKVPFKDIIWVSILQSIKFVKYELLFPGNGSKKTGCVHKIDSRLIHLLYVNIITN